MQKNDTGALAYNVRRLAHLDIPGAGQVTVNASDELDAEVLGTGIIWYIGAPKLKSKVDGLGWIKRKPFSS